MMPQEMTAFASSLQPKYMTRDKTIDHESILSIYTTVDLQKQIEHLIEITGTALCESYDEVDRLRTNATENAQRMWRLEKGLAELLQKQVGQGTKNAGFWGSFKPLQRMGSALGPGLSRPDCDISPSHKKTGVSRGMGSSLPIHHLSSSQVDSSHLRGLGSSLQDMLKSARFFPAKRFASYPSPAQNVHIVSLPCQSSQPKRQRSHS